MMHNPRTMDTSLQWYNDGDESFGLGEDSFFDAESPQVPHKKRSSSEAIGCEEHLACNKRLHRDESMMETPDASFLSGVDPSPNSSLHRMRGLDSDDDDNEEDEEGGGERKHKPLTPVQRSMTVPPPLVKIPPPQFGTPDRPFAAAVSRTPDRSFCVRVSPIPLAAHTPRTQTISVTPKATPDPAAFARASARTLHDALEDRRTPRCPSPPTRKPPVITRKNSLWDTKVLLSLEPSEVGVEFDMDSSPSSSSPSSPSAGDDGEEEEEEEERSVSESDGSSSGLFPPARKAITKATKARGHKKSHHHHHHHKKKKKKTKKDKEPRSLIGEFDLVQMGEGSFFNVYRARRRSDGRLFAIKKSKRLFRGRSDRHHFMQEITFRQRAEACEHLVEYQRAWQEKGHFYIQMELCVCNLLEYVDRLDRVRTEFLWLVAHDLAAGLAHIHAHDVLHLDVKPENVLLSAQGVLKIGDFGQASNTDDYSDGDEGDSRYLAPELLQLDAVPTCAVDMFSLGASLLQLAAGIDLPSGGPMWKELREGGARKYLPADFDTGLRAVIERLLRPHAKERMTAAEIVVLARSHLSNQSRSTLVPKALLYRKPAPMQRSGSVGVVGSAEMGHLNMVLEEDAHEDEPQLRVQEGIVYNTEDIAEEDEDEEEEEEEKGTSVATQLFNRMACD